MAGPDRPMPFEKAFWANTEKDALDGYRDRFRLLGAYINKNGELEIVRQPITGLMPSVQQGAPVTSQTGLVINLIDPRDGVVNLKLKKPASQGEGNAGNGNFIQFIRNDAVVSGINSAGAYVAPSLAELKENMKDLTDAQIKKLLDKAKIYRFNYIDLPDVVYVSPEASEFNELTAWEDGETINPLSIASIALRLVQWVWKNVDKRLKAIELKLADDAPEA